MSRPRPFFGVAAACFGAMLVLALALDCDSESGATALFWVLLIAGTLATAVGLYQGSNQRRRILAGAYGALLTGVCMFFLTGLLGYIRCGGY